LVDEGKQAVTAASFQQAMEDPGLFIVYAIANMGFSADELETALDKELDAVKDSLISEYEYSKAMNQTESDFIREKSRVQNVAQSLAQYYIFFDDAGLINDELDRYLEVGREDILAVARKYLNKENRTVLYYLPKPVEQTNDTKEGE
jgi:predicted Zn-dependent peptidase